MPPSWLTVRFAVPTPPRIMAFPRGFLVFSDMRVLPAMMAFMSLFTSALKDR